MIEIEKGTKQDLMTEAIKGLNTLMVTNKGWEGLDEKNNEFIKRGLKALANLSKEDFERVLRLQKCE